ncbi:MAG TPA: lysylphosphatidylglycerol synthase transmembrane domain-containing protein [Candidatus Dormibacteraeota bacterium]
MVSIPQRGRGTARLAVSLAGIAVVVHGIDPAALGRLLSTAAPRLLIPAVALGALAQASAFPQWAVLLRERSSLGWRPLASVFLRATFIGQALPTGVGGDAVRTVEVGRTLGYGAALGSVVASHLMGLLAMGCWAVAGSLFVSGLPAGMSRLLAAAFLLLVTALALTALNGDRVVGRCRGTHRVTRVLVDLGHSLASYRRQRRLLASAFAVCLAGWALSLVSMVLFASAVGAHPGWQVFALAVPVSLAATLLPITINGFGVREGIFVGILAHTGVGTVAATAIAVFADLQILPVALIGGAVCLGRLGARRRGTTVTGLSRLSPGCDHC